MLPMMFSVWLLALLLCGVHLYLLARFAKPLGLIDLPTERKKHTGAVPLVGGIAIFSSVLLITLAAQSSTMWSSAQNVAIALGAFLMLMTGVLDDRRGVGIIWRVIAICAAASLFSFGSALNSVALGNLVGTESVTLTGWSSNVFIIICVFGMVNAFNMLDGMDGVLGLNLLCTVVLFHGLTGEAFSIEEIAFMGALCAFLVANLRLWKILPRCFMGDGGSMCWGFLVAVYLLSAASSQLGSGKLLESVTALYIVGLPLVDMVTVTLRRISDGVSPFQPGHDHFHHLIQTYEMGKPVKLAIITFLGALYPLLGMFMHTQQINTPTQFWTIVGLGLTHAVVTGYLWRQVRAR